MSEDFREELLPEKKFGWGSVSLLLLLFALVFAFEFGGFCLGDFLLDAIGIPTWIGDTRVTMLYSLVFVIPAVVLSFRFKRDIGAKAGRICSVGYLVLIVVSFLWFGLQMLAHRAI